MGIRKGITPVVAIVLLIVVTIGAVGVVYEQFQGLVGDPTQLLQEQERLRNADYTFTSVHSSDASDPGSGTIMVTIKNTDDSLWNLSQHSTLKMGVDGSKPVAIRALQGTSYDTSISSTDCYDPGNIGNKGILERGESFTCDTGVKFPQTSWDTTRIKYYLKGINKASQSCRIRSSNSYTC